YRAAMTILADKGGLATPDRREVPHDAERRGQPEAAVGIALDVEQHARERAHPPERDLEAVAAADGDREGAAIGSDDPEPPVQGRPPRQRRVLREAPARGLSRG